MPDINTLPSARSRTGSPSQSRVSPQQQQQHAPESTTRAPSGSLSTGGGGSTANPTLNQHGSRRSSISSGNRHRAGGGGGGAGTTSPRTERQRSMVAMTLNLNPNDGTTTGGEWSGSGSSSNPWRTASPSSVSPLLPTADPHHRRTPSLGELHQQLEQEQEAQVNRLLQMIRQQELQIRQMQQAAGQTSESTGTALDDSTPTSERSLSFPSFNQPATASITHPLPPPRSPAAHSQHRSSFDLARQPSRRSRTPSRTASPAMRPVSASLSGYGDTGEVPWTLGGSRDEAAFYQAETQMLSRENQMLRMRIRELERQMNEQQQQQNQHQQQMGNPTTTSTASASSTPAAGSGGGGGSMTAPTPTAAQQMSPPASDVTATSPSANAHEGDESKTSPAA